MMDESKDEIVDDDTPTSLLPPSSHASSTPYNAGFKPDVAELFQKMGKKLGWFQYDDINSAIKSLSKSAKKKSSKSRCRQDVSGNTSTRGAQVPGVGESESSQRHGADTGSSYYPKSDERQKLSFTNDDSLSTIQENTDHGITDSYSRLVPVRKSKASTDLTKEASGRVNKLSLSAKKKQRAVNPPKSDKENHSPEIAPIRTKTKKKTVRISMIPHEIDVAESGRNRYSSNHVSKSLKTDRLSVGDVLMDDPMLESTRIHSRESIARYLPSTSSNRSSVDDLDIGDPLKESTRIHGRESIAKYLLSSSRISSEDGEGGPTDKQPKEGLLHAETSWRLGNPVQESTRLYTCSNGEKGSASRSKNSITDDISAIRNNDTSISLCFNASDTTEMDDDSYKYLKIPANTITGGKLSVDSSTNQKSLHSKECDHQDVLVNCTELYTTAAGAPDEDMAHNTVFHTICESDQSQGSETDDNNSKSSMDNLEDGDFKSGHQNIRYQRKQSSENSIGELKHKVEQRTDSEDDCLELQGNGSVSMVEVKDMSLQTSVNEGNVSISDKNDKEKVSFYEVQDLSLQVNVKEVRPSKVSNMHDQGNHNSSIHSRKSSSSSSYLEVEDASLQTSYCSLNRKSFVGTVPVHENESDSDSFDDALYKSVTMGRADQSPGNTGNQEKHQTVVDEDDESDDDDDDGYIPLKDRIRGKDRSVARRGNNAEGDKLELGTQSNDSQKSEPMEMNSDNDLPDIETKDEDSKSENTKWRTKENFNSESSDDDLETFFQKMRTPMKDKNPSQAPKDFSKDDSMDDFIVDDNDASSGSEDELFYITTTSKLPSPKKPNKKPDPVTCLSSNDEDSVFKTPRVPTKTKAKTSKIKTPRKPISDFVCDTEERFSFLKSLSSNVQDDKCNRDALRFKKNFKKMKEELTGKLYTLYNETIFDNQLPEDLNIIWNKRLLRTAGYCVYKRNASVKNSNSVRIELSTKVCDSTERVRDTLIHELCHAAVWLLHGKNDGHGPYWRLWAQKANLTHPELPVINRCHSYSIATKYTYQCSKCGYQVGRHSKSLDTKRKVCGYCHGEFVLLSNKPGSGSATSTSSTPATPRAPNKFALFVKENYGKVKGQQKDLRHGDIMKVLSKEFSEKNKIT